MIDFFFFYNKEYIFLINPKGELFVHKFFFFFLGIEKSILFMQKKNTNSFDGIKEI